MAEETSGSSIVAIFAIVILAALVVAFFVYGLPRLQGLAPAPNTIKLEIPTPSPTPAPAPAAQ